MSIPVVLVTAPFLSVVRPSLGVSNLKAVLLEAGIPVVVEYLNMSYADQIGVDLNEYITEKVPNILLVGEWVFSELVNKTPSLMSETGHLQQMRKFIPEAKLKEITSLRASVARFVEESAHRLLLHQPKIVGFSTTFEQTCASLAIAARVRELNPDITICFGGANCEGTMGRALVESYPQIDYVFSGESDFVFPEFVQRLLAQTPPFTTASSVYSRSSGLNEQNRPLINIGAPQSNQIMNMDELPVPDFTDYFAALEQASYRDRVEPTLLFETSRGCWWGAKKHCKFCGLNGAGMIYRAKSAARVLEEIEQLHRRWSLSRFEAVDNIMDVKHIESVFEVLGQRQSGYRFFYEIKSNLNRNQLLRIARGGVTWIQPGIESLHDEVLALMDKGVTALQNIRLLRCCQELGVRPMWNLLQGFPGETAEQYQRMADIVPLLEHLEPPQGPSPIRLDRFSPYFERCAELGFTNVRPAQSYEAIYGLESEVLSRLAYFFEGQAKDIRDTDYVAPLKSAMAAWRHKWYECDELPVLTILRIDSIAAVKDTRSCASQKWRCLEPNEACVLDAFRDPQNINLNLERLSNKHPELTGLPDAFHRLVEWKYILTDGARALSLVTDMCDVVHEPEVTNDFTFGWLKPLAETQPEAKLEAVGC